MRPCVCNEPSCLLCRLAREDERYQRLWGILPPRDIRCLHLLTREEFKPGCNGMKCKWSCDLRLPAVPGAYCQGCTSYAGDFDEGGVTGPGWLA